MTLTDLLTQKRDETLRRWQDLIRRTYPSGTARFLECESDRFHNPVGYAIVDGTAKLYDRLLKGESLDDAAAVAEDMIKIRSVQDFTPSEAVGFIFFLKQAIREQVASELGQDGLARQLLDLEARIDRLALDVFDIYMQCRERIFDVKVGEIKKRTFALAGNLRAGETRFRRRRVNGGGADG